MITNVAIVGALFGFILGALVVDSIGLPRTVAVLGTGLLVAIYLELQLPETRGKDLVGFTADRIATEPSTVVPVAPPSFGDEQP
jgi:hypothetical protein